MKPWIFAIFFAIFITAPVQAHPHIFVTPKATFILNDHFVSQIDVEWDFDDMSSALFLESCGSNTTEIRNLVFPETQLLANGSQVVRTSYYTTVEIDGTPVNNLIPSNFKAEFVNGNLHCHFTLNINQPIGSTMKIGFNDPTIYNDFDVQKGNFQIYNHSGSVPVLTKQTENDIDKIFLSWY